MKLKYRPEIDGLRAIAVLPVIFFHAGIEAFCGGFVGVDVFFVISGYLITSIILTEKETGNFSLLNFYERRARRILPALYGVMFVSLFFAWAWLFPNDRRDFSESVVAIILFSSNILFWGESGYFDTAAELKPLLHTWSLAVEEQFYVFFPFLLAALWKFGRKTQGILLTAIAIMSLIVAEWGVIHKPTAAFFLLPPRGWELLMGALAALYHQAIPEEKRNINILGYQIASLLGFGMILYAIFNFNQDTPFPGLFALIPTMGATFIVLFANSKTVVGKILSNKVLVGIGLISYSAYLWHQPIFSFARHRSFEELSALTIFLLFGLTLLLAFLTWRYVERPFRNKKSVTRKKVFVLAGAASIFFLAIGITGILTKGSYFRSDKEILRKLEDRIQINYGLNNENCVDEPKFSENCKTHAEPEVLLWGDSYAMHLMQGLLASNPDLKIAQMTSSACGPILGIAPNSPKYPESWGQQCIETNDKVFEWIKQIRTLKYVVLGVSSHSYVQNPAQTKNKVLLRNHKIMAADKDESLFLFRKTLEALKALGIQPVIFSPIPQNGQDIGRCLIKASYLTKPLSVCDFELKENYELFPASMDFFKQLEKDYKVISFEEKICPNDVCKAAVNDTFIYRDKSHMSQEGSAWLGQEMDFYKLLIDE